MNDRIDFAQKEMLGNQYLRPLRKLLEHVPQAGRFAHIYANGEISLRPELIRQQAEIDEDLDAVAAITQELGGILKTAETFSVLKENWRFLKTKTLSLETRDSDELYTKLMADIRALISHVGNTSNLILDPDLDSYYLMDAVLLKLPEGQDLVAQVRLFGEDIGTRKLVTAEEKARLIVLAGLVQANLDATKNGLGVAFQNNPAQNLQEVLEAPLQAFLRRAEDVLYSARAEMKQ
jgi:hypothetical protein